MKVKFEVFVPKEHYSLMIDVLDEKGFLREGNYKRCFALTDVEGHFTPLEGASPFIGKENKEEIVEEVKLEFRIEEEFASHVFDLVVATHPYEEPVINVYPVLDYSKEKSLI